MKKFINKFSKILTGVISGFDRLVFRRYLTQSVLSSHVNLFRFTKVKIHKKVLTLFSDLANVSLFTNIFLINLLDLWEPVYKHGIHLQFKFKSMGVKF